MPVCEHIKRDPPAVRHPVVFISYVDDPSQKTRGVGGVDDITKPFHDAEVLARVRTHIMNKQMRGDSNATTPKSARAGRAPPPAAGPARQPARPRLPGNRHQASPTPAARSASSSDGVLAWGTRRTGSWANASAASWTSPTKDRETIRGAIATALKEHRRELVYRIITAWGGGCGSSPRRVRRLGHAHHH